MEQTQRLWCDFYRRLGATPRLMRFAFSTAARQSTRRAYRLDEAKAFEIFQATAELTEAWYRQASYVDELGAPRAIPMSGPISLETLIRRFLPDRSPSEVVRFFSETGLVVRLANGRFRPRRRTALIARLNAITLDRFAVQLHALYGTMRWNYLDHGTQPTRLDRQVHITQLPLDLVPAFNAKVKELGALFIDQLELWVAARTPQARREPSVRAGATLVAYVDSESIGHKAKLVRGRSRQP